MTEQGYPPRQPSRPGRFRDPQEPRRTGWQVLDAFDDRASADSDVPPWAVPGGIEPVRQARRRIAEPEQVDAPAPVSADRQEPARRIRRPGRSRAAIARRRRSKRRMITWGGVAIVLALVVVAIVYLAQPAAKKGTMWVNGWQKGELSTVPDACQAVSAAALHQYLGGTPSHIQPMGEPAQSQCTYTVDAKPIFRVMNIVVQADRWSLVVGNGSATANAISSFALQRQVLAKPPKGTPWPAAAISVLTGLGNQAIGAVQVFHVTGGTITNRVTILIRYRNATINVYLQGQANGGYGPVSVPELRQGALAVARVLLAGLKSEPPAA